MKRYIIAAVTTGILFGILDGFINGNPVAVGLMECYKPIARTSVNLWAGMLGDLVYGFVISGIFILLKPALPGTNTLAKGLAYGLGIWFFRVLMGILSDWMMFEIPAATMAYLLITGLTEMLILGLINGWILKSESGSE